jgi:hypothetical protein
MRRPQIIGVRQVILRWQVYFGQRKGDNIVAAPLLSEFSTSADGDELSGAAGREVVGVVSAQSGRRPFQSSRPVQRVKRTDKVVLGSGHEH